MAYDVELLKKMIGERAATSDDPVSKAIREAIDEESDTDEIGCILEMIKDEAKSAFDRYDKFYASRTEVFVDYKVKVGPWAVEWEYIGEGSEGDYNWEDPDDYPHLRANLSWKGKPCIDGSYCTQAATTTPRAALNQAAKILIKLVKKAGGTQLHGEDPRKMSEISFPDRVMQAWTWRSYKR